MLLLGFAFQVVFVTHEGSNLAPCLFCKGSGGFPVLKATDPVPNPVLAQHGQAVPWVLKLN